MQTDHDTPDLDELERLEKAATPGPWKRSIVPSIRGVWGTNHRHIGALRRDDETLCVAARNALPALLRAARERDELAGLLARQCDATTRAVAERDELRALYMQTEERLSRAPHQSEIDELRARAEKAEARVKELEALLDESFARLDDGSGCNLVDTMKEPPCGDCLVCRIRAALAKLEARP